MGFATDVMWNSTWQDMSIGPRKSCRVYVQTDQLTTTYRSSAVALCQIGEKNQGLYMFMALDWAGGGYVSSLHRLVGLVPVTANEKKKKMLLRTACIFDGQGQTML